MLTALLLATSLAAAEAPEVIASPPHILRIAEDARATLPDGEYVLLPANTEIGAERFTYQLAPRMVDLHPDNWVFIFRDDFEDQP